MIEIPAVICRKSRGGSGFGRAVFTYRHILLFSIGKKKEKTGFIHDPGFPVFILELFMIVIQSGVHNRDRAAFSGQSQIVRHAYMSQFFHLALQPNRFPDAAAVKLFRYRIIDPNRTELVYTNQIRVIFDIGEDRVELTGQRDCMQVRQRVGLFNALGKGKLTLFFFLPGSDRCHHVKPAGRHVFQTVRIEPGV